MGRQTFQARSYAYKSTGISPVTIKVATEMALAHNIMVRNLNAIYLQASNITELKDISDFLIFCQTCYEAIHHHHDIEEEFLFPWIEEYTGKKGIMETNLEQHKAFEAGLEKFKEYTFSVAPESYDGEKLKRIIDSFGSALSTHLSDEIQTLLGLDEFGAEKLEKVWHKLDKKVIESMTDKHRIFPAALGANDRTFEGGKNANWPPLPWFVPYLVNYFYARKYAGSWRFSSTTLFGKPRELPFAVDEK